jgi:exonuclease SbcC
MKIEQLRLDDIGCFTRQAFDFEDLTVIYGENRTGKSTTVNALFFALFGAHLDRALTVADLTRKGEACGTARLRFASRGDVFRLVRPTKGTTELARRAGGDDTWDPVSGEDGEDRLHPVALSAQVAALTSFFREGELIYFLNDIPRYNTTLLQNAVRMEHVFTVRTRFNKALSLAKEEKRRSQEQLPAGAPAARDLEESRKVALELEARLAELDRQIQAIAPGIDPQHYHFLGRRCEELDARYTRAARTLQALPSRQTLDKQRREAQKTLDAPAEQPETPGGLGQRQGRLDKEMADLVEDLRLLEGQAAAPACRLCGQHLSPERVQAMAADKRERQQALDRELQEVRKTLAESENAAKVRRTAERTVSESTRQLQEVTRLEEQRTRIEAELKEARQALEQFTRDNPGITSDTRELVRRKELEAQRGQTQRRLINAKVAVKQLETDIARYDDRREALRRAERGLLVCETAAKAMESAVNSLNAKLLTRVRENIRAWADQFSFLDQFDIGLTVNQLTPIIQARGYQYKLNQMSKSERIFLYLLLKLAIGDALTHLGVFVLDDPADGLDAARKKLLARLLETIAAKRQIVVTTNDPDFADQFAAGRRIDLQPR